MSQVTLKEGNTVTQTKGMTVNVISPFIVHCTCLPPTQVIIILLGSGIIQLQKVNYKSETFLSFSKSCTSKEILKEGRKFCYHRKVPK